MKKILLLIGLISCVNYNTAFAGPLYGSGEPVVYEPLAWLSSSPEAVGLCQYLQGIDGLESAATYYCSIEGQERMARNAANDCCEGGNENYTPIAVNILNCTGRGIATEGLICDFTACQFADNDCEWGKQACFNMHVEALRRKYRFQILLGRISLENFACETMNCAMGNPTSCYLEPNRPSTRPLPKPGEKLSLSQ